MKTYPIIRLLAASFLGFTALPLQAGISVSTDFEGGSAIIESIDTENRLIRFMPGGDPKETAVGSMRLQHGGGTP